MEVAKTLYVLSLDDLKNDEKKNWVYQRAKLEFPFIDEQVVFTVAGNIYSTHPIDPWTFQHESTHILQQDKVGWQEWWNQYFLDPVFRLEQELEAHRTEYKSYCVHNLDRNARNEYLQFMLWRINNFYKPLIKITSKDITM